MKYIFNLIRIEPQWNVNNFENTRIDNLVEIRIEPQWNVNCDMGQ